MSHNIFDYQQLPALSDALQDLDTIPVNNVSVGPDTQEKLTVQALRGMMLYSSPVGAYVGPDGVANVVAFGNFRIRMNPANNATEISTIAGTESAEIYRFAAWGGGAFDNANFNALALNSTVWTSIDPLVLSGGDDMVRYWISRSSLTDNEWYEVFVWRPIAGKTCIQATRLGFQGPASPIANDFFRTLAGGVVPDGLNDTTEAITRTGMVYAKGFKAEAGAPVAGAAISDQNGFFFNGPEGDGGMHSFLGVDGAIGFATNAVTHEILRAAVGGGAWSLNGGTIAAAQAINAYHYVGIPAGSGIASQVEISSAGASVGQTDALSIVLTNGNKTNLNGPVGVIGASDVANPGGMANIGANLLFWRQGSATTNLLGFGVNTRSALGLTRRFNIYPNGLAAFDCDAGVTGLIWQTARGGVAGLQVNHTGTAFQVLGASAYGIISDRKYKDNIVPVSRELAQKAIDSVKPSTWTWNELALKERGQTGEGFGFIAQNVREFIPEAVFEMADGTLGVTESKLIPYLWAVCQSLNNQVSALTEQVQVMTGVSIPTPVIAPVGPAVTTTTTTALSVNMTKISRLTAMSEPQLTAIGFTAAQAKMFIAGSSAIKIGISTGTLLEADALRLLSSLLSGLGLTLSGVLSKL